ncbi:hypothetical protein Esti_006569 [Eimeria stiedai]
MDWPFLAVYVHLAAAAAPAAGAAAAALAACAAAAATLPVRLREWALLRGVGIAFPFTSKDIELLQGVQQQQQELLLLLLLRRYQGNEDMLDHDVRACPHLKGESEEEEGERGKDREREKESR